MRALAVALCCVLAVPAHAGPPDDAARHFESGVKLVRQHKLLDAARAFEAAWTAHAEPAYLHNAAHAYEDGGAPLDAWRAYSQLLAVEAPEALADAARDGRARVEKVLARTHARLAVETQPGGASVQVDGASFAGPWLEAGAHTVRATLEGHQPVELPVQLAAGADQRVLVRLVPVIAATPTRVDPGPAQPDPREPLELPTAAPQAPDEAGTPVTETWWFWTTIAVVAGGAIAATVVLTLPDDPEPVPAADTTWTVRFP